ncbi:gamma-interferon-responsive lysosomal thiol protein-like [Macadamia integrifolia]|uniref:gamma-interferon-responsive lysosomal thiol protein-like n=1 Tax=Macadamia integrifolia TaxID=60698 RepID=UPI001C4E7D0B|nr:gamma-interferon-responsive lysosomal thiol protein-like [Macadamia integrifolia]
MASLGFPSLLLLSCIFVFASAIASPHAPAAHKVSLALYYETLCPACSIFIVNDLAKIFHNGLIKIVDLQLVPYGNANVDSNGTITCQHGAEECFLNTVEACAIDVWPNLNEHFKFISCVEQMIISGKFKEEWKSCYHKTHLGPKHIAKCYNSPRGKKLEHKYAKMTESLKPPHEFVPWVTVNDQPLLLDYENFTSYVCKAYRGKHMPKACKQQLTHQIIPLEKASPTDEVCFTDETTKTSASYTHHQ